MKFETLESKAPQAAKSLLGWVLEREINGELLSGRIVETEAYSQEDAASHSYRGQTPRTVVMFGPPGRAYVYFTYGMHYCMNVTTGKRGQGSAVLIRALEPLNGMTTMSLMRNGKVGVELTNGPAKLCQALKIDRSLNGHNLEFLPLKLIPAKLQPNEIISVSTRIGISKDTHRKWRFYIDRNSYVSRK